VGTPCSFLGRVAYSKRLGKRKLIKRVYHINGRPYETVKNETVKSGPVKHRPVKRIENFCGNRVKIPLRLEKNGTGI